MTRRFFSTLVAFTLLVCVPAQASERGAAKRQMTAARQAVSVEVAREVRRASARLPQWPSATPLPGFAPAAAPAPQLEPPVALEPPYIEYWTLHMGGTARCTRGVWDEDPDAPYAITYRWYREGTAIPGATSNQLAITKDDIGDELACAAIADAQTEARSEPLQVRPPELQNRPRPLGQPYPGRQLMCPRGEWNDSPDARYAVTSTWLRDGEPLLGYTDVYTLTADDVGHSFSCELTAEGEFKDETRSVYGGWQPVEMRYTPDDDAIAPGATNGYIVGFRNVSPVEASLGSVIVILPEGFRYRPQTTTGALTSEPSGSEENITWNAGGLKIPAGGEVSFHFGVSSGAAPVGHHWLRSYATGDDSIVGFGDAWEVARITIEAPFTQTCTVNGTPGDDVLSGTPGDDVICGGGGDDVLRGGEGADVLFGGEGADRLDGGEGDDTLLGGDGEDQLITGAGADLMRGGGGLDSVSYATRRAPVAVTLGESADDGEDGEGDDVDADVEIIRGGRASDFLAGTTGPEEFYAGSGDDRIVSGGGGDLIEAGDGNDSIETGFYDYVDRLFCGSGYDSYMSGDEDRVSACEFMESRPEH